MHGVVDEVQRDRDTGILTLIEHKTRRRPSLPSAPQQQQARLQASLYRSLLEGLQHMRPAEVCACDAWPGECAAAQGTHTACFFRRVSPSQFMEYFAGISAGELDPDKTLGLDVQGHLIDIFGYPSTTLIEVSQQVVATAADMEMWFSDEVIVRYWWQVRSCTLQLLHHASVPTL